MTADQLVESVDGPIAVVEGVVTRLLLPAPRRSS